VNPSRRLIANIAALVSWLDVDTVVMWALGGQPLRRLRLDRHPQTPTPMVGYGGCALGERGRTRRPGNAKRALRASARSPASATVIRSFASGHRLLARAYRGRVPRLGVEPALERRVGDRRPGLGDGLQQLARGRAAPRAQDVARWHGRAGRDRQG
jgi:hypothetical protein